MKQQVMSPEPEPRSGRTKAIDDRPDPRNRNGTDLYLQIQYFKIWQWIIGGNSPIIYPN